MPTDSQGSPARGSRLDGPPPLPPKLSDKNAPDLATLSGTPSAGTPPTGQLAQVVLEHAQLVEQIIVSIGRMLPAFVPIGAQMQASLRLGVVKALKESMANPSQSLAQGAGPSIPPQGGGAPQGAPPPGGGVPAPPPGAGGAPPVGAGPQ